MLVMAGVKKRERTHPVSLTPPCSFRERSHFEVSRGCMPSDPTDRPFEIGQYAFLQALLHALLRSSSHPGPLCLSFLRPLFFLLPLVPLRSLCTRASAYSITPSLVLRERGFKYVAASVYSSGRIILKEKYIFVYQSTFVSINIRDLLCGISNDRTFFHTL